LSVDIGYHCSHEQHAPSVLLRNAELAVRAGFGAIMCSDHFAPWSVQAGQGHSGFAWSWLGAALARTSGASFGVVTAPGQRYHPAVIAQAAATLAEMNPDRFWLALGSGEALNEHITGQAWPHKRARQQRLRECAEVMAALFRGEVVNHDGAIHLHEARLHTRPARAPALLGAAISEETAVWMAGWVDGLITVPRPEQEMRRFVERFRENGGAGKPLYLQVPMSWAPTEAEAEEIAFVGWRAAVVGSAAFKADTTLPEHFDDAAGHMRREDIRRSVRVSASLQQHLDWCARDHQMGFDRVYLHHVGPDQPAFIEAFAAMAGMRR
jgi:coenzyme F420-dependent glucose-6-phosphate dehydrogenase